MRAQTFVILIMSSFITRFPVLRTLNQSLIWLELAHAGWLYSHTVAKDAQCMRGFCIETTRASSPSDYIFENMVLSKQRR